MSASPAPRGGRITVRRALARRALLGTGFREAVVVVTALWLALAYRGTPPRMSGDQRVWLDGAYGHGFLDVVLGKRPPLVPWIHQVAGFDNERVVWLQLGLQLGAMALFSSELAAFAKRRWSRNGAFVACLAWLVLDSDDWAFVVRSEAVAHATLLAFFATLLGFLRTSLHTRRRPARCYAAFTLVFAVASLMARDTAAYVALSCGLALPALLVAARRSFRLDLASALLSLSLLSAGAVGTRLTELSGRQLTPLDNLLVGRVFRNPRRTAYFVKVEGLPWSEKLASHAQTRLRGHSAGIEDPGLEAYRSWLAERGSSAYRSYLLENLGDSVSLAARRYGSFLSADYRREYLGMPRHAGLEATRNATRGVDPSSGWPRLWPWLLAALTAVSLFSRRRDARLLGVTGLSVVVASCLVAFVVVHGDAMEVHRHGAIVGVLVRNVATPLAVAGMLVWVRRTWRLRVPRTARWRPRHLGVERGLDAVGRGVCLAAVILVLAAHGGPARPNIAGTSVERGLNGSSAALFDGDLAIASTCLPAGRSLTLVFARPVADFYVFRGTDGPIAPGLEVTWFTRAGERRGNLIPGERGWLNPRVLQVDQQAAIGGIEVRAGGKEQCLAEVRAY